MGALTCCQPGRDRRVCVQPGCLSDGCQTQRRKTNRTEKRFFLAHTSIPAAQEAGLRPEALEGDRMSTLAMHPSEAKLTLNDPVTY